MAGLHDERPIGRRRVVPCGDQHLALEQIDASGGGAEGNAQRAVGVDQQASAVGQGQVLLLTDGCVLIGHPRLPWQFSLRQPNGRARQQKQPDAIERLTPTDAFIATNALDGVAGDRAWHRAKVPHDRLGPLPRLCMLGAARAPALDRAMVFIGGATGLQLHQPVGGFTEDFRVDGGGHQATLRQARKASRM